ncbi:MFS transporter [Bacillus velezensis]|uniref:MFS transporter n=1 Tax=Bacillus velezensis TaxID=492670 RepID=UPI0015F4EAF0|nr:MFS transporter [Bacillus velezensis]QMT21001.1 MFS transporter [Bacillus velezensis]
MKHQTFSNVANRLDRLPISRVHYQVLTALGIIYFFDLADLFTLSNVAPALIEHWGVKLSTIADITAASFLGMFLGASIGGRLSDRIGRKKALNCFVLVFSISSFLNALAWDIPSLMIFRFLTGLGVAAAMIVTNSYLAEFFPSSVRGKYISLCAMIGLIGVPVTNVVSAFVIPLGSWGWRLVFVWGAAGLIYFFFIRRLEESPRWHENRGAYDQANAIMNRLEARAEKEKGPLPAPKEAAEVHTVKHAGYLGLFQGRNLKITIILSAVWILETFGFYGFASWVPSLLKSNGMTFIPVMIIVFGFVVNVTERVFTSNLYAYTSEPYPTEYRSAGSGLAYGLGRFSNIFGSLLVGFIAVKLGYISGFLFIGGCWLLCSVLLILFGPKTNAQQI